MCFIVTLEKGGRLFPPCLFPDAVKDFLTDIVTFFSVQGNLAAFCRMLELPVTTFLVNLNPAISF